MFEPSPLDKIMTVNIDKKSRLSAEDQAYIDEISAARDKIINFFHNEIKRAENELISAPFFNKNEYIELLVERKAGVSFDLVNKVVRYFTGKYNVTLDAEAITKKHLNVKHYHKSCHSGVGYEKNEHYRRGEKIPYGDPIKIKTLLDEIFNQLGGMSFKEKEENEIVTASRKALTGWKEHPVVKKDKIIFPRLPAQYQYGRNENVPTLFKALSFFETGSGVIVEEFEKFSGYSYPQGLNIYTKNEFVSTEKVKAIRYYMNGKGEIWFKDNATACEFARKFIGI